MKRLIFASLCLILLSTSVSDAAWKRSADNYWKRSGTDLSPTNSGDSLSVGSGSGSLQVDTDGDGIANWFDDGVTGFIVGPGFKWDSSGKWWFEDQTTGTTYFGNIPGRAGVTGQFMGGALWGVGALNADSIIGGASPYPMTAGDATLDTTMTRGVILHTQGTASYNISLPPISSAAGATIFVKYIDTGSGVTFRSSGTSIYITDGASYSAGSTIWCAPNRGGSKILVIPVYTATSGWYYDASISGVSWQIRNNTAVVGNTWIQ
jgi:hypothetical protein